jgi:hypothetical protein
MVVRVITYNPATSGSKEAALKAAEIHNVSGPLGGSKIMTEAELREKIRRDAEIEQKNKILAKQLLAVGLSFALPGMGSMIGSQLVAANVITNAAIANAVGTATASIAVQMAQGADFDEALKNATVNAIIQTGAPSVATEINKVVKIPAVSDAITSAGASALKTVVAGGNAADVEKNILGALVGSATASATGSNIAGAAAGGGVTGGVAGAAAGAAGAYASQLEAERIAKEKAAKIASGSSRDPGIKVAGGDDATALNMASISAMPEMLGKSGETASPLTSVVESGETFYERTITGKTPDGKEYSYKVTYDPGAAVGKQISYTTGGLMKDVEGNVIPSGGGSASASSTRPDYKDYKPTLITFGSVTDRTPSKPPTTIPTTTPSAGSPTTGEDITGGTVTGGGTGGRSTTGEIGTGSTGTITDVRGGDGMVGTGTGSVSSGAGMGAGDGSGEGGGRGGTGTGTGGEGDGTGGGEEEEPTDKKGKPYRPNLFVYGGTRPTTLPQTLGTSVEKVPTAGTTTGTSVGLGGRGEIESKESGKKRKTVWNEESLRLKDALGL